MFSFQWRSSSEEEYDMVSFYIDGELKDEISGETDWQQKTYAITSEGEHSVFWVYEKDYTASAFYDCAWVDDIVWNPATKQSILLKPGWNLVTLERPIVAEDAEKFLGLRPKMLNAGYYVFCPNIDSLKIGVGYWIFSTQELPMELSPDLTQLSWETAGLNPGWNFIGMAVNSNWQNQAGTIWQWLNGGFSRGTTDSLSRGNAYWVRP